MLQTQATLERIEADPRIVTESSRLYRHEVNQFHLLPSDTINHLAEQIVDARKTKGCKGKRLEVQSRETSEAKEAKQQLIEANLRLVLEIARWYRRTGVDLMDLVQEGNLGLIHAVEKFDHRKGYRFSTYATWWIRQYITRALAEQSLISIPAYKIAEMKRVQKYQGQLEKRFVEPASEELAAQTDATHSVALQSYREIASLDRAWQDENSLGDIIEDESGDVPETSVLAAILREQIQEILGTLSQQEQRVLQLRYGFDTGFNSEFQEFSRILAHTSDDSHHRNATYSLSEAGKKLDLSHEAVRQTEFRALQKLHALCQSRGLQDFLRR